MDRASQQRSAATISRADDRKIESPKSAVPAVARAARLLDMLAEAREPLSLATITTHMGLPKSTVHGLCTTLVHAGLLTRFENGTYHLGLHVMDLAHAFLERTDLTAEFVNQWESLALPPDQTIILAVLDGADVVYIACRNGTRPLGFNFRIGMRLPANCTASGKAMLASLPPERVKELMTVAGLRRLTKKKTGGMNGLLKQLAEVRKSGFSRDDEETCDNMLCFGAPVFDSRSGEAVAGVAVSMPKEPVLPRRCELAVRAVKQMARALSKRLGARTDLLASGAAAVAKPKPTEA